MRKIDLEELKTIQLSILDDIHAFCVENNLRYSLCGGTMLGAVRHKGYIPWDDDIDLMMPRSDYKRFCEIYQSNENELVDLSNVETCTEQFVKVCRKGTVMEDVHLHRKMWGINVDILPIDGLPDDFSPYISEIQHLHESVAKICPYYKVVGQNRLLWFLKYCLKRALFFSSKNVLQIKERLNDMAYNNLPENSPLSTVIYGDFMVYPFPSHIFFDYEPIEFEGNTYPCIKDRHLYLSTVYKDYMTLPPKEKQVSHHLYDAYIID